MIVVCCERDKLCVITPCKVDPAATGQFSYQLESDVALRKDPEELIIQQVSIPYCLIGEMVRYNHASCRYEAEEVIKRARNTERSWDFETYASEHFAMWVKTGEASCPQRVANQSKALEVTVATTV